jgi:hypothetical protein
MKLKDIKDKEPGKNAVNSTVSSSGSYNPNENNTEREDEEE